MTGEATDSTMGRAGLIGVLGAAIVGSNAALEVTFTPTPWSQGAFMGVIGATALFGFFCPALASLAGDAVRRLGDAGRRAALWAPMLVGVGLAMSTAYHGRMLDGVTAVTTVALAGVVAAIAQRALPTLSRPPDGFLAPLLVVWVILSAVFVGTLGDVAQPVTDLMVLAPALCGVGAILVQVFHRTFEDWSSRTLLVMAGAGFALTEVSVGWLASWLPSLNSRLKLLVALSALVALVAVVEPALRRLRPGRKTAIWSVAALLLAAFGGVTLSSSVPERFGGLDPRSTAGLAVSVFSRLDDRDGDGFYDEAAGGNDCDDADPSRHPLAPSSNQNCLPGGFPPVAAGVSVDHDGDVIVLLVDAVRADVFADEELRERFPAFDAIASESVRFTTAYSPGNSTFTSLPSLLTGYAPNLIMTSVIRPESVSYDELAGQNWWFDGGGGDVCRAMIAQSHDAAAWLFPYYPREIDVRVTDVRVNEVLHSSEYLPESVAKVLRGCSGRRMGLVLYADDPHLQLGKGHACAEGGTGGFDCYLDEIEAVDSALTKVIKQLKKAGRWDDAAIIVTADHGEAFGERGHVGHTSNVFEEQVRVPLWLRVPGIAPREEARPVSGLSVAPTAVELLGGIPRRSVYPSLLPLATATEGADYPPPIAESATGRMKKAWTSPQTAIRSGRYKVIYDWRTAYSALYDLESDPDEREPLTDHPEKERLTGTLLRIERTLLTEWQQR